MGKSNHRIGKEFEDLACKVLTKLFHTVFSDGPAKICIGTNEKK